MEFWIMEQTAQRANDSDKSKNVFLARWAVTCFSILHKPQGVALGWVNKGPLAQKIPHLAANG
jgi:hypothetical protein